MNSISRKYFRVFIQLGAFALLMSLFALGSKAQSTCATATTLNVSPAGATCLSPTLATFSGTCTSTPVPPPCGSCSQAIWMQLNPVPPIAGQKVNLDFTIDFLTPNTGCYSYSLVYAEASDNGNGDPCSWSTTSPTTLQSFTLWESGDQFNVGTAPFSLSFEGNGLDGTATYFLVLYYSLGTVGGDVSVCAQLDPVTPYCTSPSYDTCANAISMTLGNGIDSGVTTGTGNGSWAEALTVTTQCASKVRMGPENIGVNNEDHFSINMGGGVYYPIATPGDDPLGVPFGITPSCFGSMENSIFINFTPPIFSTDYILSIGDLNCGSASDSITVMIVDNLDCNDAANTNMIAGGCASFGQTGSFPTSPDFSFGPLTLNGGQTYSIIIDGVQGAQCDLQILLSRTIPNNVLLAGFVSAHGYPYGSASLLEWGWSNPAEVEGYRIERSLDGKNFEWIAETGSETNSFLDNDPPAGTIDYRISALGQSGQVLDRAQLQVDHHPSGLILGEATFHSASETLHLSLSSQNNGVGYLRMLDLSGRVLNKTPIDIQEGRNSIDLQMPGLSPGVYLAEIRLGSHQLPIKLMVR